MLKIAAMVAETHDFAPGKRKQVVHGRAAGQGLAYRFQKIKILGSDQYPASGDPVFVYYALNTGKKVGRSLNLVDDRSVGKLTYERGRVLRRESSRVMGLEIYVWVFRKNRLARGPVSVTEGNFSADFTSFGTMSRSIIMDLKHTGNQVNSNFFFETA